MIERQQIRITKNKNIQNNPMEIKGRFTQRMVIIGKFKNYFELIKDENEKIRGKDMAI